MKNPNRALIIDDEPEIQEFFCDVAEEMGFDTGRAGDRNEFADAYARLDPSVILLDLTMPDTDGIELLRELSKLDCKAPIILASGKDERVLATAQRLGRMFGLNMKGVLQKPVSVPDLEAVLRGLEVAPPSGKWTPSRKNLDHAIRSDDMTVFYQPKVDLQADGFPIVGSEALLRWRHPEQGLIGPEEFLPLAESEGMIAELTEIVLTQVVEQLKKWLKQGYALPISVNLSPRQLTDLSLPDRIAGLLSENGLEPSLLVVEVTEDAAMADIEAATEILTRLRLKNIAVSLDDFGAGYSSLVEIYRLPLSELKIDRSLAMDLAEDEGAGTVLKAITALGHAFGLSVCVEGVETEASARFLKSIGCDRGQGYHFSKPLPADDYFALLSRWSARDLSDADEGEEENAKSFQRRYLEARIFNGAKKA